MRWRFHFLPWAINLVFTALYCNNSSLPLSLLMNSEFFVVRDYVFPSLNFQYMVQCLTHGGCSANEWAVNYTFINYYKRLPTLDGMLAEINVMVCPTGSQSFLNKKSMSLLDTATVYDSQDNCGQILQIKLFNVNIRMKRPNNECYLLLPLLKENKNSVSTQMCLALSKYFVQGTK